MLATSGWDQETLLVLAGVIAFLGEGLARSTERMRAKKPLIRRWAVGLGLVTGIPWAYFYVRDEQQLTPDTLLVGIAGAALAAGFSGLLWYFVVALVAFVYLHVVAPPLRLVGWVFRGMRRGASQLRARQEEEERRRRWQCERERAAPEQKRREDARAGCEIFYGLHAPEIGSRFTRQMFDAFVARYMGDDRPAEYVEQRAQQLRDTIQRHLERVEPPQKELSLADLAQWFLNEREQIAATALSEADKEVMLAQLEEHYARLQERHIRRMRPS